MADASEDSLLSASVRGTNIDSDSEDDDLPPDFLRLLRSTKPKDGGGGIPKRGIKDFESNFTLLQSRTLQASREAMWDALGVIRVHHPATIRRKSRIAPSTAIDPGVSFEDDDIAMRQEGGTPIAVYQPTTGLTLVPKEYIRGSMFMRLGRDLSGGGIELLPEEALWALEGSKLDIRYPSSIWNHGEAGLLSEINGVPMSLQGAHAAYIGEEESRKGQLTLEKYIVFAALKRLGYIVLRAPEWYGSGDTKATALEDFIPNQSSSIIARWLSWLLSSSPSADQETLQSRTLRQGYGPLVPYGYYRSHADIFRLLRLIPVFDPKTPVELAGTTAHSPYTIHWNVYKPPGSKKDEKDPQEKVATWRKSNPGEPDFRICVVSTQDTTLPTLAELNNLMNQQSFCLPPKPGTAPSRPEPFPAVYNRLKHGYKNVILAVVDQGIVSYIRLADAGFTHERLYEREGSDQRGSKGGGRGRGNRRCSRGARGGTRSATH